MAQITLIEAVTQALAYEMKADDSVVVLGEDVGVNGGVFRATVGLQQKFGAERVIDTPLDETTIAGLTVGLAAQGMKPIAEAQFEGFIYPMMEHIACHAARLRTRTRGRMSCPAVKAPMTMPKHMARAKPNTASPPTSTNGIMARKVVTCVSTVRDKVSLTERSSSSGIGMVL